MSKELGAIVMTFIFPLLDLPRHYYLASHNNRPPLLARQNRNCFNFLQVRHITEIAIGTALTLCDKQVDIKTSVLFC